ncbi:MAG TPA: threonine ammonia-lyase [Stellaceae bacterium]|nr:threonine ammonia-lyase [Stellaceae bacterium]
MSLPVALADIRAAADAIAGAVLRTPAVAAPALAEIAQGEVVLKLETLHPTGSFKERGALNKLLSLDADRRRAGVIALSAGNHAQGVARHARRLGIPATIVMPADTPFTKVEHTEAYGARVLLRGSSLAEARRVADALAAAEGLSLIHPYDDAAIIAGQGTIALELLADRPDLDALLVPVGGGGLIAGIAIAAKALKPGIAVFGVQAALYAGMAQALGRAGPPPGGTTLAEGIAVLEPGRLTRPVVAALVDDLLLVDEAALERAVARLLDAEKLIVEGAGAAPLAALLANAERFRGRRVGLVLSGGNIDSRLLASILQRQLVRSGRLVGLRIELSDQPGALGRIADIIGESGGNIVEVYHRRLFQDVPAKLAVVDAVVELRNRHVEDLVAALAAAGFPTGLLSSRALEGS